MSAVAACSSDPPAADGPLGDSIDFETGLTLEFVADEELPAEIDGASGEVRVSEIYLNGAVIRAIGDATTADERPTTRYDFPLHWATDDEPRGLEFTSAPPGAYSYVELRIASRPGPERRDAFELRGEANVGGSWRDFLIEGEAPVVVARVPASTKLEVDRPLTIKVELDVSRLVSSIEFAALPELDGKLRIDERTPAELAAFTDLLADAFRVR
jgi:hypothetical protein